MRSTLTIRPWIAVAAAVAIAGCPGDADSPSSEAPGLDVVEDAPSDQPPAVVITSPADQQVYAEGTAVILAATVGDDRDAAQDLSLVWTSSVAGVLGEQPASPGGISSLQVTLEPATHVIRLTATDSAGNSGAAEVEVLVNALPGAPEVTIAPAEPRTTDDLVVSVVSAALDPNRAAAELTYRFEWDVDGAVSPVDTDTVQASLTARGQGWTVRVSAHDGHGQGVAATASVTIGNSPPACAAAELGPAEPQTSDTLTCSCASWTDPDGVDEPQAPTCAFFADGQAIEAAGDDGSCTLDPAYTSGSMALTCTLTPGDGEDTGPPVTSLPLIIANALPVVGLVTLSSQGGTMCDAWTCAAEGVADPDGDDVTLAYRWTLEGETLDASGGTLEGVMLGAGDHLQCFVKATDGTTGADGELVYSEEIASTPAIVSGAGAIPIIGLESDGEGFAAWNVKGSGSEPIATGHSVPLFPGIVAYYYAASRDWSNIDPGAEGSFHGVEGVEGFAAFTAALDANGFEIGDLGVSHGLHSLGEDKLGQDWFTSGLSETRIYNGGTFTLRLAGEDLVTGAMPTIENVIELGNPFDFEDDLITVQTEQAVCEDASAGSSAAVQAVAQAFLEDVALGGIRFDFEARQPSIQTEFEGNGRKGAFFDVPTGAIEAVNCSP